MVSAALCCKPRLPSPPKHQAVLQVQPRPRSKGTRPALRLVPRWATRNFLTRLPRFESTAPTSQETSFCPTKPRTQPALKNSMPPNNFHPSTVQAAIRCRIAYSLSQFRANRSHIRAILHHSRFFRAMPRSQWAAILVQLFLSLQPLGQLEIQPLCLGLTLERVSSVALHPHLQVIS